MQTPTRACLNKKRLL